MSFQLITFRKIRKIPITRRVHNKLTSHTSSQMFVKYIKNDVKLRICQVLMSQRIIIGRIR